MGKHLLPRSEEHRKKLSDAQKRAQENQELLARRRAWFLSIRNTNGPGLNYTHSNKFKQRASALWKDGLSVSEIANRLKVKKTSFLDWPIVIGRFSPIADLLLRSHNQVATLSPLTAPTN